MADAGTSKAAGPMQTKLASIAGLKVKAQKSLVYR